MPRPALFALALLAAGMAPVSAQPASEGAGDSSTGIEAVGGAISTSVSGSGSLDARPGDGDVGAGGSVTVSAGETSLTLGAGASVPTTGQQPAAPARQIVPEPAPVVTAPTAIIEGETETENTCSDAVSGNLLRAAEIVPINADHPLAIVPVCASVALDEASMSELRPFIASNARLSEALATSGYGPDDVVAISRDTDAIILYVPQG